MPKRLLGKHPAIVVAPRVPCLPLTPPVTYSPRPNSLTQRIMCRRTRQPAKTGQAWLIARGPPPPPPPPAATDARYSVARDAIVAALKDALGPHGALHTMPIRQMPPRFKGD